MTTTVRKTLTYNRNLGGNGAVRFTNETAVLTLLDADYDALGQPETITVTIEAGEAEGARDVAMDSDDPLTRVRCLARYWAAEAERVEGAGLYREWRFRAEFLDNTIEGTVDGYWPDDDEIAALAGES